MIDHLYEGEFCPTAETGIRDVELAPDLYHQIRQMARRYMHGERSDHTLQTTALVNEAYLRLAPRGALDGVDARHFCCLFASAMREILIDHARQKKALKRGGGWQRVSPEQAERTCDPADLDLLALDEALHKLARTEPRMTRVVELRFFAGLNEIQIAEALGVSAVTVRRDWRMARMLLRRELDPGAGRLD